MLTSRKSAVGCGGNDPKQTKTNTMQTTEITASTPSIRCSLAIGVARVNQNKKKWNFDPAANVRKNGEIPTRHPKLSHRVGEKSVRNKIAFATFRQNLIEEKQNKKQIAALRSLTTQTGLRWSFLKNGTLQVGRKFATREQKAQLAALL